MERVRMKFRSISYIGLALCSAVTLVGCAQQQRVSVRFKTVVEPRKPLPPDVRTLAVVPGGDWLHRHPQTTRVDVRANLAVIIGHAWADRESFDVSGPAADMVMQRLQREIDRQGLPLRVVDRETFDQQLAERELAISDLVNPDGVVKLPGMAPVDALLVVKATATSNVERVPVDTFTINDISRAIATDGKYVQTSPRMSVQRQITVNTSMRLTNAITGVVHDSYSSPRSQADMARPGFLVGDNMSEANLPPGGEVVQKLLDQQVEEFVAQIVGAEVDGRAVAIAASNNKDCQMGVRLLAGESWSQALAAFQRAIAANPADHHAQFGAGVASEKLGRLSEALQYYEAALALKGSANYVEAVRRVQQHL
jgi:hypothetical protein